jgi:hypothetical protein
MIVAGNPQGQCAAQRGERLHRRIDLSKHDRQRYRGDAGGNNWLNDCLAMNRRQCLAGRAVGHDRAHRQPHGQDFERAPPGRPQRNPDLAATGDRLDRADADRERVDCSIDSFRRRPLLETVLDALETEGSLASGPGPGGDHLRQDCRAEVKKRPFSLVAVCGRAAGKPWHQPIHRRRRARLGRPTGCGDRDQSAPDQHPAAAHTHLMVLQSR